MISLLLALALQIPAQPIGIVNGKVLGAGGAPASNIRVYALAAGDSTAVTNGTTALEAITQTDTSGRYRLEIAPGRYYIASGSVQTPTFFPGTGNVAAARVVNVVAGGTVENVDISGYVLPRPGLASSIPAGTGVLSGTLRHPNGSPAADIPVAAVETAGRLMRAVSDINGSYSILSVPPGTYSILAGYAGISSKYSATVTIPAMTAATPPLSDRKEHLDFQVQLPTERGVIRGKVVTPEGLPLGGVYVSVRSTQVMTDLPAPPGGQVAAAPDGTFQFTNLIPGSYVVAVNAGGVNSSSPVAVGTTPATIEMHLPVFTVSGRVVWEDGTPFPNPAGQIKAVRVATVNNPNMITGTILALDAEGNFSRFVEAQRSRIYVDTLPEQYAVTAITEGSTDLLHETFDAGAKSYKVEVRIGKRTGATGVSVSGRVNRSDPQMRLDDVFVALCCFKNMTFERLSTKIRDDGTFAFGDVPPGSYSVGLRGASLYVDNDPTVNVADQNISDVVLTARPQKTQVSIRTRVEGAGFPPNAGVVELVITSSPSFTRLSESIQVNTVPGGTATVALMTGVIYNVNVRALPQGLKLKSVVNRIIDRSTSSTATTGEPPSIDITTSSFTAGESLIEVILQPAP